MIKRICVYSLPEGTDPDEFWKYHKDVHGPFIKKLAGDALQGYRINRVTRSLEGKQQFFGLVEMWWESEEAMNKAREAYLPSKHVKEWGEQVTNLYMAFVEEYVIK
jgi:uncharacterized protein (TIGR02118 family)